jgi:hypothetical protein
VAINDQGKPRASLRSYFEVFRYSRRAAELVWTTSRRLSVALGALSLLSGLVPAAIAYIGKLIVDAVVLASQSGATQDRDQALAWVALELGLVAVQAASQKCRWRSSKTANSTTACRGRGARPRRAR